MFYSEKNDEFCDKKTAAAYHERTSKKSDIKLALQSAVSKAQSVSGGSWSAAVVVMNSGESFCVNDNPMQAASLIKLYIMGAVYENYETLLSAEPELEVYLRNMITVSDNYSANYLVTLLGEGIADVGKRAVNSYLKSGGYKNSCMGRMLLESSDYGDNYTSAADCAGFFLRICAGELPHSGDMLGLLESQKLTSKIPAGVPLGVRTANKTGELLSVQNDAAAVFAENPYILCVMAENVEEASAAASIAELSSDIYLTLNIDINRQLVYNYERDLSSNTAVVKQIK